MADEQAEQANFADAVQQPDAGQADPQLDFALAPALVGADRPINYATRAGQSLYSYATAPLPYIFDGKPNTIPAFLQAVHNRAAASGWGDIFSIGVRQDPNNNNQWIFKDLLTQYGEITIEQIKRNAIADYMGHSNRNAQVSHQIFQCLQASVSDAVTKRLVTETSKYYINGSPDGPSYLMTLILTYTVRTQAIAERICLDISKAYELIAELDYNIDDFNTAINAYVQDLAASGETTQDLFAHVSRAYKTVPDKSFRSYIQAKVDNHNDGTAPLTVRDLMDKAKAHYDEEIAEKVWRAQDETDKQLVALTAQLEQIEQLNQQLKKKLSNKTNERKGGGQKANNNFKNNKRNNNKQNRNQSTNKWKWKEVSPKPGQTTKTFEGKTYYWCVHHKKWCLHKTEECRLKDRASSPNNEPPAIEDERPQGTTTHEAKAFQMVLNEDGAFADL